MSAQIDNRIVEMSFENKEFEKGARETMATLKELEKQLQFEDAEEGFEKITKSAKKVDLGPIEESLQAITDKFSLLGMTGLKTIERWAERISNGAERIVKSLTVDPVKDGWGEYELKLNSVQTILAGVRKQFNNDDEALESINANLGALNEYADKTIYSFSQMTANIGKFTNAGVDLDKATASIRGISNLAALAGASSADNNRAMYNIAQSLSTGSVKLIDWKSIENANMATKEFKNTLVTVANRMGKLKNGKTKKGLDVINDFNDSLKEEWLSSEVLIEALGFLAKDYKSVEDIMALGYTQEQAEELFQLGVNAEAAATEVRTLTQLMDTLKEAAGSGWAESFEILVGGYKEAKRIFTSINDYVSPILEALSNRRNNILTVFAETGGRDKMWDTVLNFFNLLQRLYWVIDRVINNALSPFGDVWNKTGNTLTKVFTDINEGFETFNEWLRGFGRDKEGWWTDDSPLGRLEKTLNGVGGIVRIVVKIAANAIGLVFKLGKLVLPVINGILKIGSVIGDHLFKMAKREEKNNSVAGFFERVYAVLYPIVSFVTNILAVSLDKVADWIDKWIKIFSIILDPSVLWASFSDRKDISELGKLIINRVQKVIQPLKKVFKDIKHWWDTIAQPVLSLLGDYFAGHGKGSDFAKNLRKAPKEVQQAWMKFYKVYKKIKKFVDPIIKFFKDLFKALDDAFGAFRKTPYDDAVSPLENFDRRLKAFIDSFTGSEWWKGVLETWDNIKSFFTDRFGPAIAAFMNVDTSDGKTLGEKLQMRIDAFLNVLDPDGSIRAQVDKIKEALAGGFETIKAYLFGGEIMEKQPNKKAKKVVYEGILTPFFESISGSLAYAEQQVTKTLFGEKKSVLDEATGLMVERWEGGPLSFLANFYDDWVAPLLKDITDMAGAVPNAIMMLFDENLTDSKGNKLNFGQRLDLALTTLKTNLEVSMTQLKADVNKILFGKKIEYRNEKGELVSKWVEGPLSDVANIYEEWIAPIVGDLGQYVGIIPSAIAKIFDFTATDEKGNPLSLKQRFDLAIAGIKTDFTTATTNLIKDVKDILRPIGESIEETLFGTPMEKVTVSSDGTKVVKKYWEGGPLSAFRTFYDDYIAPLVNDISQYIGIIPNTIALLFDANATDEKGNKLTFEQRLQRAVDGIKADFERITSKLDTDLQNLVDGIFGPGTAKSIEDSFNKVKTWLQNAWTDVKRFLFGGFVEEVDDGDEGGYTYLRYQEGLFEKISKWELPTGQNLWESLKYFLFGGEEKKADGTVVHHKNIIERIQDTWNNLKAWYDKDVGPWLNPILEDLKTVATLFTEGIINFFTMDIPDEDGEGNILTWQQKLDMRFSGFSDLLTWLRDKINNLTKEIFGFELFTEKTGEENGEGSKGGFFTQVFGGLGIGTASEELDTQLAALAEELEQATDPEKKKEIEGQMKVLEAKVPGNGLSSLFESGGVLSSDGALFGKDGLFGENGIFGEGGFLSNFGDKALPIIGVGGAAFLGGKLFGGSGGGDDGGGGLFSKFIDFLGQIGDFAIKLAGAVAIFAVVDRLTGGGVKEQLNNLVVFIAEILGVLIGGSAIENGGIGLINIIRKYFYDKNTEGVEGAKEFEKTTVPDMTKMIEALGTGLEAIANAIWKFLGLAMLLSVLPSNLLGGNILDVVGKVISIMIPGLVIMAILMALLGFMFSQVGQIADKEQDKDVRKEIWGSLAGSISGTAEAIEKIADAISKIVYIIAIANIFGGIQGMLGGFLLVGSVMILLAVLFAAFGGMIGHMTEYVNATKDLKFSKLFSLFFVPIISAVIGIGVLALMLAGALAILPDDIDIERMKVFSAMVAVIGIVTGAIAVFMMKMAADEDFKPDWSKLGKMTVAILVGVMAVFLSMALLLGGLSVFDTIDITSERAIAFTGMAATVSGIVAGIAAMVEAFGTKEKSPGWGDLGKSMVAILIGVAAVALSTGILLLGLHLLEGIKWDPAAAAIFVGLAESVAVVVGLVSECATKIARASSTITLGQFGKAFLVIIAIAAIIAVVIWIITEITKANMATIADLMSGVGTGLSDFNRVMNNYTNDEVDANSKKVERIVQMMTYISTQTMDFKKIDNMRSTLWRLGTNLSQTINKLKPYDEETIKKVAAYPEIFARKIVELSTMEGDFDLALSKITKANDIVVQFQGAMTGISGTSDNKERLVADAQAVKEIATELVGVSDELLLVKDTSSITQNITTLSGAIGLFVGALRQMAEEGEWTINDEGLIEQIDPELMKAFFLTLAESIPDVNSDLYEKTSAWAQAGDGGAGLSSFALGMENLKTAVKDYAKTISDPTIDWDAIGHSETFLNTISDISTKLPTDYTFATTLNQNKSNLDLFSTDVIKLGNAVGAYGTAVKDAKIENLTGSADFLTRLADISVTLRGSLVTSDGKTVTWDEAVNSFGFFSITTESRTTLGTFAEDIALIAGAIGDFVAVLNTDEYSQEQFDAAVGSLGLIADLAIKLTATARDSDGNLVILNDVLGGIWSHQTVAGDNLKTFGDSLKNVGTGVSSFINSLKENGQYKDTSILSTTAANLKDFVDRARELSFTYETVTDFGTTKAYTIGKLGEDIKSFSDNVLGIASKVRANLTNENLAELDRLRTLVLEPYINLVTSLSALGFKDDAVVSDPKKTPLGILSEAIKTFVTALDTDTGLTSLTSYVTQFTLMADALERINAANATLTQTGLPTISIVVDDSGIPKGSEAFDGLTGGGYSLTFSAYTEGMLAKLQNGDITLKIDNTQFTALHNDIVNVSSAVATLGDRIDGMQVVLDSMALVGQIAAPMNQALAQFD